MGATGAGKSSILRLIQACITNNQSALEYFGLPSLIGADMQPDIKSFTALKLRVDELNETEQKYQ